ncbi:MAG TPA: TonB-dependent receptor [Burkholderiaceae bacterium]|nr:TonB-dependent receptor [Burkholderiaceae bacterium]
MELSDQRVRLSGARGELSAERVRSSGGRRAGARRAKRPWPPLSAAGFTLLAACGPAAAHTSAEHEATLGDVEIAAHYDNSVGSSDAASQGVITSRLLKTRPALRPGEVLEFVPGMIVTQHSGDGKANQYFLRGFNLDHGTDFATWVAGMPVNLPTHGHGHGYTDLNFLIPELVERIEYRKGPYYASNGDFSSAGSAHVALRRTLDQGFGSVTLGSYGYRRLLAAASPKLVNGGTLLAAVEAQGADGPWENPQSLRKWNGVLRYSDGSRSSGFDLTMMAYHARWNSTDQIPRRAVDAGLIGRFGAVDPTDGGNSDRYSLSGEWRRALADGMVVASAYAIHYRLNLFSNFTYALDNEVDGDQFLQRDQRNVFGGRVARVWYGRLGGLPVTNEIGLQARHDRIRVGLFDSAARQITATTRDDRVRQSSVGLYGENGITWTPWLRTVAGLRADQYQWKVASNLAVNSGNESAGIVSPKLSAIFGPWAKTEYFVNWGRGFHSNDARGTVIRVDPKTGDPATPVTGLVRTTGYEVGVRSEWLPGLQTSLAVWRLNMGSELLFVGDAGTTEAGRPSRRQGVEWSNRYQPLQWLSFDLDFAVSHARFTDGDPAGDRIPGAVSRVASAAVAVRDVGPWSGSLQLRYLGPRPLVEDGNVTARSTTLVSARVGYRIGKRAELSFDVFNLLNRRVDDIEYFYTSRLRGEAAPVDDRHFHPAEPRVFRLTLQLTL